MDLTRELPFKVGDEIKNYKEMCKLLGEKVRTGGAKQSQLKRWRNYFNWEHKGYRFIITEVFNQSFPAHDDNFIGLNVKYYSENLQRLILNILYQKGVQKSRYKVILSLKEITMLAKVANKTSFQIRQNDKRINKIAKDIDVNPEIMSETINRAHTTAYGDVKTALNQLKRKGLIEYSTTKMLCVNKRFDNGIPAETLSEMRGVFPMKIFNDLYQLHGLFVCDTLSDDMTPEEQEREYNRNLKENLTSRELTFHEANDVEVAAMLHLGHKVITQLGANDLYEIYQSGKILDYLKLLKSMSQKYLGIEYMFDGYKILFSPSAIQQQIKKNKELYKLKPSEQKQIEEGLQRGFADVYLSNFDKYLKEADEQYRIGFDDPDEIDPFASEYIKSILNEKDARQQVEEILRFIMDFENKLT